MANRDVDRPDTVVIGALDEILGTRSRVQVLRVLAEVRQQAWPSQIVRAAHLPRSTVWDALRRLEAQGIVTSWPIEVHRQIPRRLSPGHPLAEPLRTLFRAEAEGGLITDPEAVARQERREFEERLETMLRERGIPVDA